LSSSPHEPRAEPSSIDRLSSRDDADDDANNSNNPLFYEVDKSDETGQGDVHIPAGGVSISDAMEEAQWKDRFVTKVVPVTDLPGVAQLVTTTATTGSLEPVRYLVALSPPSSDSNHNETNSHSNNTTTATDDYVLVDVPPYSPQLVAQMQAFMGGTRGRLTAILVTHRDAIHYDEAPAVLATRRADLDQWRQAFAKNDSDAALPPAIVAYRLDIPRDCRHAVTQVLDGYGPFAWQEATTADTNVNASSSAFVETGRPLTYHEWNHDVAQDVMSGKLAPDDAAAAATTTSANGNKDGDVADDDDDDYTPEKIRQREQGHRLLAVYTPGRTFGSVSYVFPEMGVCCSGFTLPVEDNRLDDDNNNYGTSAPGPVLDCRGYVTTSRAGIQRQTASATRLIREYGDRFWVVLPSRGDPLFLDGVADRQSVLLETVEQYRRIGEIYEQLGITGASEDDDDDIE